MDNEFEIANHISQRFDSELEEVRSKVLRMGGLVENQVSDGVKALIENKSKLAKKVAGNDYKVNHLEVEIDQQCVDIIARRQPAASDLRLVISIIKTIADLERIGDQAEKLGILAQKISESGTATSHFVELEHLGDLVSEMLRSALDSFARMDVDDALLAIERNAKIDKEFDALSRQLITHMMEDPREIKNALRISWCARALERMGAYSKNICEYVIYFVHGADVRHTTLEETKETIS